MFEYKTMHENISENASIDAATIDELRTTWFQRLERIYPSITERSGLECDTRCSARCCPKSRSIQNADDAVGHVAIMLPFEVEYILDRTDIEPDQLKTERIEVTPGTYIDIAFTTSDVPCPFLTDDNKCGIYAIRPLDCRSFPLIPVFDTKGAIEFRVDGECPSVITFSNAYKTQLRVLWEELLPYLPMSYRLLYNRL